MNLKEKKWKIRYFQLTFLPTFHAEVFRNANMFSELVLECNWKKKPVYVRPVCMSVSSLMHIVIPTGQALQRQWCARQDLEGTHGHVWLPPVGRKTTQVTLVQGPEKIYCQLQSNKTGKKSTRGALAQMWDTFWHRAAAGPQLYKCFSSMAVRILRIWEFSICTKNEAYVLPTTVALELWK